MIPNISLFSGGLEQLLRIKIRSQPILTVVKSIKPYFFRKCKTLCGLDFTVWICICHVIVGFWSFGYFFDYFLHIKCNMIFKNWSNARTPAYVCHLRRIVLFLRRLKSTGGLAQRKKQAFGSILPVYTKKYEK